MKMSSGLDTVASRRVSAQLLLIRLVYTVYYTLTVHLSIVVVIVLNNKIVELLRLQLQFEKLN